MKQSDIEKKILAFWKQNDTFRKSVEKSAPKGDFVFYDGPPFATGTPHYGHIVASLMKDMVPRYWTMRGYRVERRWGWDCHGLPIENIVEKEHGFKHKKDILAYGVDKFNEDARSRVLIYALQWREVINRLGRWVDFDNDYKTMDASFMESIWWAFKQLYDKGLLYEAYRSMHICPRCETTLAQSEVAQGYKDVQDLSVIAKFKVKSDPNDPNYIRMTRILSSRGLDKHSRNHGHGIEPDSRESSGVEGREIPPQDHDAPIYLLAWTTTPWTLPGNAALAVGEDIKYVFVEINNQTPNIKHQENTNNQNSKEYLILAKTIFEKWTEEKKIEGEVIKTIKGKDLVGLEYEPLFPYYDNDKTENYKNGFKVYDADFVNTEEGTGIVHIAPAFGEDDMNLGKAKNLPFIQHVNMDGTLAFGENNQTPKTNNQTADDILKKLPGMRVKHQDEPNTEDHPEKGPESVDVLIIKYLAARGLLFSKEKYTHSYPHCWRCDSPLLNYAASSWFVNVTKIKEKMLKEAKDINWIPEHIKDGRFGNWLEGARDWSISRQRFWGSVLPIWKSEDGKEIKVIGSIDELREQSDAKITKIIFVRHGESEKNILHVHSSALDKHPLTKTGEKQVQDLAKALSGEPIDAIISSPILRARSTAEAAAKKLGLKIRLDDRLLEDKNGVWEEKSQADQDKDKSFREYLSSPLEKRFEYKLGNGESAAEVCNRVEDFIKSLAKDFAGQTIVVVSHGIVSAAFDYILNKGSLEKFYYLCDYTPFATPQFYYLNEDGSGFDLHKHYIDRLTLKGKSGQPLQRIPDVLDCWFESGSMPFAQSHYPFENKEKFEKNFPAQFIAEGVDQTRAWFYYLHVLSTALQGSESFKNVVVNGIVLAQDGKKMSKRFNNYPDPMEMFDKYGADAVRYYLATSTVVHAEDLNFSEKGVEEVVKKILLVLYNVLSFYKLYTGDEVSSFKFQVSRNTLDKWIISKTEQLTKDITEAYDNYDLNKATRPIAEFINELSTWYLQCSRERIKDGDTEALATLKWTLEKLALVMAPVMPFTAEYVWQELGNKESVHLESWPKAGEIDEKVLEKMSIVRKVVEMGLAKRAEAGIKVRQPLSSARIPSKGEKLEQEYTDLIKNKLNVKEVNYDFKIDLFETISIDSSITIELKQEGMLRELVRTINGMRKTAGLTPGDVITLQYQTDSEELKKVFAQYGDELKKSVIASEIKEGKGGEEVNVNGEKVKIEIKK